jgi:hypothetical protein
MPLIDDQSRGTDRRPQARWAWVLVAVGLCVVWLMIAAAVSLVPRAMQSSATANGMGAVKRVHMDRLNYVERLTQFGDWQNAALEIQAVDGEALGTFEKHNFFRLGAKTMLQTKSPAAGAKYYERFLAMGASVRSQECQGCHRPSALPPLNLVDMERTQLGKQWTGALTKAHKLRETRDRLRAEVKQNPEDARLHILLYHLETATRETKEAAEHAQKLSELDATGG